MVVLVFVICGGLLLFVFGMRFWRVCYGVDDVIFIVEVIGLRWVLCYGVGDVVGVVVLIRYMFGILLGKLYCDVLC